MRRRRGRNDAINHFSCNTILPLASSLHLRAIMPVTKIYASQDEVQLIIPEKIWPCCLINICLICVFREKARWERKLLFHHVGKPILRELCNWGNLIACISHSRNGETVGAWKDGFTAPVQGVTLLVTQLSKSQDTSASTGPLQVDIVIIHCCAHKH